MIILIMNDKTVDKLSKVKTTGELDHYCLIERYYGGDVLTNKVFLSNMIFNDLSSITSVYKPTVLLINNVQALFNSAIEEAMSDEDISRFDNTMEMIYMTLKRLIHMGHNVVVVSPTNKYDFKDLDVTYSDSLINVLNSVTNEGLNEYDNSANIVDESIIDLVARFEDTVY